MFESACCGSGGMSSAVASAAPPVKSAPGPGHLHSHLPTIHCRRADPGRQLQGRAVEHVHPGGRPHTAGVWVHLSMPRSLASPVPGALCTPCAGSCAPPFLGRSTCSGHICVSLMAGGWSLHSCLPHHGKPEAHRIVPLQTHREGLAPQPSRAQQARQRRQQLRCPRNESGRALLHSSCVFFRS